MDDVRIEVDDNKADETEKDGIGWPPCPDIFNYEEMESG